MTDQAPQNARKKRKKARQEQTDDAPKVYVLPAAGPAKMRSRHKALIGLFLGLVLLPVLVAAWYLWNRAEDQYASTLGFTVRREDTGTAAELLGGLSMLSGSASSDSDVLYEYIQSQEIVRTIDAELDLRAIWSRAWPRDPVFALPPEGSVEDLLDHWRRMVRISYDGATGLIELRVLAFSPDDAQTIAQEILAESQEMINRLSAIAREDATRYASEELERTQDRLSEAREKLTAYRSRNQIVDPEADIQGQVGLLNTLQQQLAAALIDKDMLSENASPGDPRREQVQQRIDVIRARIAEERQKFGSADAPGTDQSYADVVAQYESLASDRQFAEESYLAARTAYDSARAEAQRQSRYLAAYITPTRAEHPEYPQRWMLLGLVALFTTLAFSIISLVYYSLRDRR